MTEREAEEGFRVRDRRRREDGDSPPADQRSEPGPVSPPPQAPPPPPAERSLVGLFVMLASLAMAALEGVPDPTTGRTQRDSQQTAEIIDLLMLLREKTEGHRTAEESQMLDGLIYDLQVRFVQATTPPGQPRGPAPH